MNYRGWKPTVVHLTFRSELDELTGVTLVIVEDVFGRLPKATIITAKIPIKSPATCTAFRLFFKNQTANIAVTPACRPRMVLTSPGLGDITFARTIAILPIALNMDAASNSSQKAWLTLPRGIPVNNICTPYTRLTATKTANKTKTRGRPFLTK
jgi:hypothetical protein